MSKKFVFSVAVKSRKKMVFFEVKRPLIISKTLQFNNGTDLRHYPYFLSVSTDKKIRSWVESVERRIQHSEILIVKYANPRI